MELAILDRPRDVNEQEDEFHGNKNVNDESIRLVCFKCWNAYEDTTKYITSEGKPSNAFRKKSALLLETSNSRDKYLAHWNLHHGQDQKIDAVIMHKLTHLYAGASDWVTGVGPGDNVVVLYACKDCNSAPLRTNGWVKAKTCRSGSYARTQWHCPNCAMKWTWGACAKDRWILLYKDANDYAPTHFTWGSDP
eukprot:2789154-Amphidinium_carterae.8